MNSTQRVALYRSLVRIRRIEDYLAKRYQSEQLMRCPAHFSVGQEAVAVAVSAHLRPEDRVVSAHRSHAHYLAKGGSLRAMVSELYGKSTGATLGRGGSMHLLDEAVGFAGATPIVGSAIPIAAGMAFADKLRKLDRTTVVYFGDGATETGVFHETMNFSSLHGLPIVFACENNLYSMETGLQARQPSDRPITDLARAHRVMFAELEGQDVEAACQGFGEILKRSKEAAAPCFVEFRTYRFIQHCGPKYDGTDAYRRPGEYERETSRDPVSVQRRRLSAANLWSDVQERELCAEIEHEIAEAIEFAFSSPFPDRSDLLSHVYAE
jgi:TPP-dependent pyruvate/acetoin dehydrogenase alpha subunit